MTRHFCDVCGNELTDTTTRLQNGGETEGRIAFKMGGLEFEIITGWNGTTNAGEFCDGCIFDAVAQRDTRTVGERAR